MLPPVFSLYLLRVIRGTQVNIIFYGYLACSRITNFYVFSPKLFNFFRKCLFYLSPHQNLLRIFYDDGVPRGNQIISEIFKFFKLILMSLLLICTTKTWSSLTVLSSPVECQAFLLFRPSNPTLYLIWLCVTQNIVFYVLY